MEMFQSWKEKKTYDKVNYPAVEVSKWHDENGMCRQPGEGRAVKDLNCRSRPLKLILVKKETK